MTRNFKRAASLMVTMLMLISLLVPAAAAEGETNLVSNYDFSEGTAGWRIDAATAAVDESESYGGLATMKYTKTSKAGKMWTNSITLNEGERYLIAVNVKVGEGQTSLVAVEMRHTSDDGTTYDEAVQATVGSSWKTLKKIYTCTKLGGDTVDLALKTDNNTMSDKTYYFNNFRVIPLDSVANGSNEKPAEEEKNTAEFRSEIYVDGEKGSDSNAGTLQSPYKTIEHARDVIRTFNKEMESDINVYLRGGNYEITEPIQFTKSDSGTNGHKIIWQNYQEEAPFVRGPKVIEGWQVFDASKNIYCAKADGPIETRSLYVNGERAVRAKSNTGLSDAERTDEGLITSDTFLANWKNQSDIEMVFAQNWTLPRQGVDNIKIGDDGRCYITMKQPGWKSAINKGQTSCKTPWYYENAFELLDEPGEWYLDRSTYTFYYMPRLGEDMNTAEIVAPTLEELMSVRGDSEDKPVENLEFRGIQFGYSTWLRPNSEWGVSDAQNNHMRDSSPKPKGVSGDWLPPAAINVQYGHGITFDSCVFSKIGLNALQLIDGIQGCTVNGNLFYDISSSCVNLGEPYTHDTNNYNPKEEKYLIKNNTITNNYMHDVCKEYMSAAAISAGFPQDTLISHNEIFHIPYSGMHLGYGWVGIPTSAIKNFDVTHNYIHDLFYTKLYDGGGIYTIGPTGASEEDPNMLAYNYITDMNNDGGPIYNDQGSTYYKVYKNVMDQSRAIDWVSGKPKWFKGWGKDISHCFADENYTNISHVVRDGGDYNEIKGTIYCPQGWPQEALDIIDEAGLEPEYLHMSQVPQKILLDKDLFTLNSGETEKLSYRVETSKNKDFDTSKAEVLYGSRDESVAKVSQDGTVTAVSRGSTHVDILIRYNGITVRNSVLVQVDDTAEKVNIVSEKNGVLKGDDLTVSVEGESLFGTKLPVSDVIYESGNPSVLTVVGDGVLRGMQEGYATVTATAVCGGKTFTDSMEIRVVDYVSSSPASFTPYDISPILSDVNNWTVEGSGTKTAKDGGIVFNTPGGSANYTGQKFTNEIFDFDINIDNQGGWPSIQFRMQEGNKTANNSTGYIMVIKESEIELQRFNGGSRRVFFGDVEGALAFGGKAYPNGPNVLPYKKTVHVQAGAMNEASGVRLVLTVDGKRIFDYLDTDAGRITQPGYFGIVSRNGTVTATPHSQEVVTGGESAGTNEPQEPDGIVTGNEDVYDALKDKYSPVKPPVEIETPEAEEPIVAAGEFQDTKGHWAENLIYKMYRNNMITGVSDTMFEPDRPITRAEFLTLTLRWLKYEKDMEWSRHASSWGTPTFQAKIKAQQAVFDKAVASAGTENWYQEILTGAQFADLIDGALLSADYDLKADITREEMASMLMRAYRYLTFETIYGNGKDFADKAQIADWAQDDVRSLSAIGYLEGDETGNFRPKATATRAEAAALIQRVYEVVEIR